MKKGFAAVREGRERRRGREATYIRSDTHMWRERVLFVKVNERPLVTVLVHNAERRQGEYQPKSRKKELHGKDG